MNRAWPIALVLLASGCGWIRASSAEYGAYRQTRVGPTFEARLAASHAYLKKYPHGAYADEVRGYFEEAEPVFFRSRERDPRGLASYLETLPSGPHAREVRSRLAAIRENTSGPDSLSVAAEATEARLAANAKARERAASELTFFVDGLTDPEAYAGPLPQGPADLLVAFALALPAPVCKPADIGRLCEKEVTADFVVPSPNGVVERQMSYVVTLAEDASGRPTRARIEGEELFSRLEEARSIRPIDPTSVDDRVAAVARAVELVTASFEARVSGDSSCRKDVRVPEVAHFECKGMRAVAIAGTEPGAPDVIELGPVTP